MPQPFTGTWTFNPRSIEERPKLARHIATIAAMWSHIDLQLARVFARVIDAEGNVGAAMYLALISEQARDAAMLAGVESSVLADLSPNLAEEFESLMSRIKTPRKKRNTVVHGLWAIPNENPDTLVLIDARKLARALALEETQFAVQTRRSSNRQDSNESMFRAHRAIAEAKNSGLEYAEQDFIEIENDIDNALKLIVDFYQQVPRRF